MSYHASHRCRACGERFDSHAAENNPLAPIGRCPGKPADMRFPTTIKDQARAQEVFGKRLERFWSARKTTFSPN